MGSFAIATPLGWCGLGGGAYRKGGVARRAAMRHAPSGRGEGADGGNRRPRSLAARYKAAERAATAGGASPERKLETEASKSRGVSSCGECPAAKVSSEALGKP